MSSSSSADIEAVAAKMPEIQASHYGPAQQDEGMYRNVQNFRGGSDTTMACRESWPTACLCEPTQVCICSVQVMWAEPMTPRLPAKYSNLLASDSGPPTMADSNFSEGSILQHTAETGAMSNHINMQTSAAFQQFSGQQCHLISFRFAAEASRSGV